MEDQFLGLALGGGLTFRRFVITEADLTTAAGVHTQTLFTLPKGGKILGVNIKHSTAFAGGGASAVTVSVGKSGSITAFASAFDIFQAVADGTLQETSEFKSLGLNAVAIIATFTVTGANASALTAGQVEIDILYLNLTTPL